jgi:transcription-repair coupling factor (superfamily II helicase)
VSSFEQYHTHFDERLFGQAFSSTVKVVGTRSLLSIAFLCANRESQIRPLLVVVAEDADVIRFTENLLFVDPSTEARVLSLSGSDNSPYSGLSPQRRALGARMGFLARLLNPQPGDILVASLPSLLQRTLPAATFSEMSLRIEKGSLVDAGFYSKLNQLGFHPRRKRSFKTL